MFSQGEEFDSPDPKVLLFLNPSNPDESKTVWAPNSMFLQLSLLACMYMFNVTL